MMAAAVKTAGGNFERETPRVLFSGTWITGSFLGPHVYDVTRDGQRFLFVQPIQSHGVEPLTLLINWQAGLRK